MRLFSKIFLCFLFIILLVGTTLETSGLLARYYEERWQGVLHSIMPMEAEKTARLFEASGVQATRDYLDQLQAQKSVRFYFFDNHGNELLGRGAPELIVKMASNEEALSRTARQNLSSVNPRQGAALRLVDGPSGRKYVFAFQQSPTLILPLSDKVGQHPYIRLLVIGLLGAVLCFFLTRHITKPIVNLSAAAGGIAAGRLKTRVDSTVRRRHDEIGVLGRDFDRMAERIEALVTAQRDLLGDVSHELRSPLARLIVALTLLRTCPREEAAEYLNRIGVESDRLDKLIGQLLTLTRIDSGVDAVRETFDLTNLVHEVAADGDFEGRVHNRSVTIVSADACAMTGMPELLRSAIENVVRNAVRHTHPETAVEITLKRDEGWLDTNGDSLLRKYNLSKPRATLRVRDHGPGVAENRLPVIFLPFRRAIETANVGPSPGEANESGEVETSGAGLGLAIAERVVRMHEGTIRAVNASDGGLIVEIELPLTNRAT